MILGVKYFKIEVLQVILCFLVKKLSCTRFLVAAILNRPIWPLGGTFPCLSADSEMSRSCQPVTKNSDFCNEVNDSTIL